MTEKRQAPYQHSDGSNCWTKNCRRARVKVSTGNSTSANLTDTVKKIREQIEQKLEQERKELEFFQNAFNRNKKILSAIPTFPNPENARISTLEIAKREGFIEIPVNDEHTILATGRFHYRGFDSVSSPRQDQYVWLIQHGKPVGYLKYSIGGSFEMKDWNPKTKRYENPREVNYEPIINSIEIKKEYRGKGLGVKLVQYAEKYVAGQTIYSGGHYTPEGYRSLFGKFPISSQKEDNKEPSIIFDSMSFIHDWDKLQAND
jgi:GNAT superfamily N-acetyltransferase